MHYEFNIRHMSGVFSGLLKAKPSEFTDAEKLVLLWIHESERNMAGNTEIHVSQFSSHLQYIFVIQMSRPKSCSCKTKLA